MLACWKFDKGKLQQRVLRQGTVLNVTHWSSARPLRVSEVMYRLSLELRYVHTPAFIPWLRYGGVSVPTVETG